MECVSNIFKTDDSTSHNSNHTKLVKSDYRCVQLHSSLTKVIIAKFWFVGDSVGPRHPVAS